MERSTREIEIKLPFGDVDEARERLVGLGATVSRQRVFEDNVVFDRSVDPLIDRGILLRLRTAGDRALLTLKRPVENEGQRYKIREEHQTTLEDPQAMLRILDALGYTRIYRYQKYRTQYALGELELCLDETPLGCFVELEGSPEAIDRTAERLGFDPGQYVRQTYRELHKGAIREGRAREGDLLL